MDSAVESASLSSISPFNFSSQSHFYLAVDRLQFKMETLVDLLGMAGRHPCLPMVVCCNSRDELDAVCYALSNLSYVSVTPLYSDLSEVDRAVVLDKFRQATIKWNQNASIRSEDNKDTENEEQKSRVVIATDACLPLLASGEAPVSARVLINFELPTKKETYMRRMATCLAADGIVINMVVGGEVVILKGIEESSSLIIAEMPINLEPNREMTVEEFRAWLRRFDSDHDGKISRDELSEALHSLGIWFGWWKAREGIKVADSDGNGYLSNSKEIEKLVKYAQKHLNMKISKSAW